jgi:hypothetical protein
MRYNAPLNVQTTNPAVRVGRPDRVRSCGKWHDQRALRDRNEQRATTATTYATGDMPFSAFCNGWQLAVAVWQAIYKGSPGTER